ncbi:MAG: SEC-C metal-binding domain-containing protein [Acidobacteriota bacterium]|nr:SEC-C metal-binding domain-containing protein [Acidobacteriota bacterium]
MKEKSDPRPGRNDPCHCESGRKYKQCCLEKDEAEEREARKQAAAEAPPPSEEDAPPPPPKHGTEQPWKRPRADTHGFQRTVKNRRIGES